MSEEAKETRSARIHLRLTLNDSKLIREAASRRGVPITQFIIEAALDALPFEVV